MTLLTGTVESKARSGKSIQVAGTWYGAFSSAQLDGIERGDNVEFDWSDSKCGRFKNIKGNARKAGGNATPSAPSSNQSSGGYQKAPQGRSFPVGTLAPERTINRQNALTNAVAFIKDYSTESDPDVRADLVIEIARKFESYTTGDLDLEKAKQAMEEIGG